MNRLVSMMLVALVTGAPLVSFADGKKKLKPTQVAVRDAQTPRVGNATTLVTKELVDELTITYSPKSEVEIVEKVPTNGTKLVLWRPKYAGVATITTPGHKALTVSIRYDGVPLGGVLIMLLAGFILFGGAFVSLRALLASS